MSFSGDDELDRPNRIEQQLPQSFRIAKNQCGPFVDNKSSRKSDG
jgi:hypothetical protein